MNYVKFIKLSLNYKKEALYNKQHNNPVARSITIHPPDKRDFMYLIL